MGRPSVKGSQARRAVELAEGYVRLPFRSPFLQALGPAYVRENGSRRSFAVRIVPRHLNAAGFAHGGFLVTFADAAMSWAHGARVPRITVSLNCDFLGAAREGEWLEIDVDVQREGRTLVFVNGNLRVGERAIAHASCVLRTRR